MELVYIQQVHASGITQPMEVVRLDGKIRLCIA